MTKDPTTLGKGDKKPLSDPITPVIPDYDLIRVIGKGSFGEVWVALDATGSPCALKIIYKGESDDQIFNKELEGVTSYLPISRSNLGLVTILHVGKDPESEFYYYTMELADNANESVGKEWENYQAKTLSSIIGSTNNLVPISKFEEISLNLSNGLAYLHEQGLVHRDIKPSNVIFVNGHAKLADVGLVSVRADASTFIGTAGYIPPEGPGKPAADVFALGKTLYELLTGKNISAFPELPTQIFTNKSESHKFAEYNKIIVQATSPDYRERPQNGGEFSRLFRGMGKAIKKKRLSEVRTKRPRVFSLGIFSLVSLMLVGLFFFSPDSKSIPFEDFRFKHFRYYNNVGSNLLDGIYNVSEQDGISIDCHFREGLLDKAVAYYKGKLHTVLFFNSEKTIHLNLISIDEWKKNLLMKIIGDPFAKFPHEIMLVRQFNKKGEVLTEASFQNSLIRSGKTSLSNRNLFVSGGRGELIWHAFEDTWSQKYEDGILKESVNSQNTVNHKFDGVPDSQRKLHQVLFSNGESIRMLTEGDEETGNFTESTALMLGQKTLFLNINNYLDASLSTNTSVMLDENNYEIRRKVIYNKQMENQDSNGVTTVENEFKFVVR
ncbi:MAG: serine/threonine-protein kinase [Verrucomicrobiota bacterium]|nr:serine/threonine-protein kinase [Verrucomicrobiota bacterium]